MTDITTIPDADLQTDLLESLADIRACQSALNAGITTYGDNPAGYVQKRLDANLYFVKVIKAEQERRRIVDDQA